MKKKDQASIMHLMSAVLACMAVGLMAVFLTGWMQALNQKEAMDTVSRKYLLYMETQGYCTEEAKRLLEEELGNLGCENLDFTGTTVAPVGYGQEIRLCIRGTVSYYLIGEQSSGFFRQAVTAPISISLSSTAKH